MPPKADLKKWQVHSYGAALGCHYPQWNISESGQQVVQATNSEPSIFYSNFNFYNAKLLAKVSVTSDDDDYFGFVLGYQPDNPESSYLLVDWKSADEGDANLGLTLSEVTGYPTAELLWKHQRNVMEITRGKTLGFAGYERNREYSFYFIFLQNKVKVFVDGQLEIEADGDFSEGRFGFYNYAQKDVTYSAVVPESLFSGYYLIQSKYNDLVMDISASQLTPGTGVVTYYPTGEANQLWKLTSTGTIVSKMHGFALDFENSEISPYGLIVVNPLQVIQGLPSQRWKIEEGFIKNQDDENLAIDIEGAKPEPLAPLRGALVNEDINQQWEFVPVETD